MEFLPASNVLLSGSYLRDKEQEQELSPPKKIVGKVSVSYL